MFEQRRLMFLYAVSPVHVGASTALGVIDNPIQREKHTDHPMIAGSGLKGALRSVASGKVGDLSTTEVFGPEARDDLHAGAASFADAQLVTFPVRSPRHGFVYATSALALGRLARLMGVVNSAADWKIPEPAPNEAATCAAQDGDKLDLELFQYSAEASEDVKAIATWLAENAFPAGDEHDYFRNKILRDLVVLPEDDFGYFVKHSTSVEPHVRINDETGTADDGGLFFTENLPPEAILASVCMASRVRSRNGSADAAAVMQALRVEYDGKLVQVGGDSTTGRGHVVIRFGGETP